MSNSFELQEANLRDLHALFLHRSDGPWALELIGNPPKDLSITLRDHRERGIHDPTEVKTRSAFDDALNFFGLLEIGIQAGYIMSALPPEVRDRTRALLEHPALRNYYEMFYPLPLPVCLRLRLDGFECALPAENESRPIRLFQDFLTIELAIGGNHSVRYFLAMLDDFSVGGYTFADLETVLRSPEQYLARSLREPDSLDALDHALQGLSTIIRFWLRLSNLLQSAAEFPLLRASFWHHHAYWFRRAGGHAQHRVVSLMRTILTWPWLQVQLSPTDREDQHRALEAVERDAARLTDLFSDENGDSLMRYLSAKSNDAQNRVSLDLNNTRYDADRVFGNAIRAWTVAVHELLSDPYWTRNKDRRTILIAVAEDLFAVYAGTHQSHASGLHTRRAEMSTDEWKRRILNALQRR